jgi:hypothetical protein
MTELCGHLAASGTASKASFSRPSSLAARACFFEVASDSDAQCGNICGQTTEGGDNHACSGRFGLMEDCWRCGG